jgi:hypothetical protein
MAIEAGFERGTGGGTQGRRLVVILHGWCGSPKKMGDVRAAVVERLTEDAAGLDLFIPALPHAAVLSMVAPSRITADLVDSMARICADPTTYRDIILVGHSTGAVLARRLFLAGAGADALVTSEAELAGLPSQTWAGKVSRIISLAGLNRGWVRSGRLDWAEGFVMAAMALLGHMLLGSWMPTVFHLRRGAPFIVTTRLQWMAMRRDPNRRTPIVVQLLGTKDNLVAPDDAIDFAVDGEENGGYFYIELPRTDHGQAKVFTATKKDPDGSLGRERRRRFQEALAEDADGLARIAVDPRFLTDTLPPQPDPSVADVVFVIHGIRDDGYWTRRIAQRIRETPGGAAFRCLTPTYGYFAMLPFVAWWIRTEKVEWLMDQYVGAMSAFPNARFHYVGHSNGTYLLARGLRDYPGVRFNRVLFAGSVVRRNYNWRDILKAGQVSVVANMIATADWVVALFPTGLEPWPVFDLGGAGFGGFRSPEGDDVHQLRYVVGDHSAALTETQWPVIAGFIINGTPPAQPHPDYAHAQSGPLVVAARHPRLTILALLAFALAGIPGLVLWVLWLAGVSLGVHFLAGFAVAYFLLLRLVVTRV